MIQRIQSLYLLLVAVLTGLMLLMPLGTFLGGTEEMYLTAFGFSDAADGTPVLTAYGLAATVIAAALLPFVTIFLYKKRLLQFRLCVVETVLLAGVMLFEIYYICGASRRSPFQPGNSPPPPSSRPFRSSSPTLRCGASGKISFW